MDVITFLLSNWAMTHFVSCNPIVGGSQNCNWQAESTDISKTIAIHQNHLGCLSSWRQVCPMISWLCVIVSTFQRNYFWTWLELQFEGRKNFISLRMFLCQLFSSGYTKNIWCSRYLALADISE